MSFSLNAYVPSFRGSDTPRVFPGYLLRITVCRLWQNWTSHDFTYPVVLVAVGYSIVQSEEKRGELF